MRETPPHAAWRGEHATWTGLDWTPPGIDEDDDPTPPGRGDRARRGPWPLWRWRVPLDRTGAYQLATAPRPPARRGAVDG